MLNIYMVLQTVRRLETVDVAPTRYSLAKAHRCSYSKMSPMCLLLENLGLVKVFIYNHRPNVVCRRYALSIAGEKIVVTIDRSKHQSELPF